MGNKIRRSPLFLDFDYYDGGGNLYTATPHYIIRSYDRTASDLPRHRSLERAGSSATNPSLIEIKDAKFTPGAHTLKNISRWDSWYGRITTVKRFATVYAHDTTLVSAPKIASINNQALIRAIKKVHSHLQSDFSGPQFLGELHETIGMIRKPFETIRKKTGLLLNLHDRIKRDRAIRKGRQPNWANVISSTWLEFAFGVQPAVSDISEICHLLNEKLSKPPGIARVSATFSDEEVADFFETHSYTGEAGGCSLHTRRVCRHSRKYVMGIKRSFPSTFGMTVPAQNLIEYGKFELTEIVPTAWELIPWSWLIDYVVNVGDLLACTFDYNAKVAWISLTDLDTCERTRTSTGHWTYTTHRQSLGVKPEVFWTKYARYQRSNPSSLGFPELEFGLPSIGQANNALQALIQIASSNPKKG